MPDEMRAIAGGTVTLVWQNGVGGLTGRVDGSPRCYIKWNPHGSGESLRDEAERLQWLRGRHPAPAVLDYQTTGASELLVTAALPGRSAVDARWIDRPADAIRAIAEGLRVLHALPVEDCPYVWRASSPAAPEIDRLVVCHGDPCAPNTLIGDDGRFAGNVDFGRLGTADRWADLAVATMSLGWNYRDYDEGLFWRSYGIAPDIPRIEYYRALWNAT